MIQVTKDEAEYIRKHCDYIHIAVTNKAKRGKRKRYYVAEYRELAILLKQYYTKVNSEINKGE